MKALPWREGLFKPLLSRLQESPPSSSLLVSILLMTRILLVSKRICVFSPPVSSTRMPLPEIPLPLFLLLEELSAPQNDPLLGMCTQTCSKRWSWHMLPWSYNL